MSQQFSVGVNVPLMSCPALSVKSDLGFFVNGANLCIPKI